MPEIDPFKLVREISKGNETNRERAVRLRLNRTLWSPGGFFLPTASLDARTKNNGKPDD